MFPSKFPSLTRCIGMLSSRLAVISQTKGDVMARWIQARYDGHCRKCGQTITKGQYITWNRRERGVAYHLDCANVDAIPGDNQDAQANVESVQPEPIPTNSNDALTTLARAIEPLLTKQQGNGSVDRDQVEAIVSEMLDTRASLTIVIDNRQTGAQVTIDNAHSMMTKLIYLVQARQHSYLYGPSGSGKSTAAKQVADALSLEYGYISLNPQTPDSRLLGFIDANGNYRDTVFYRMYRDGGVFCIDEMDNASPSLLTTLNSCLENGHAAFPCGLVPRHENFVLVATGNTCGRGANPQFPERRPFDAAFAERFAYLAWEYDTKLERTITVASNPEHGAQWFDWIQSVREYAKANYPKLLVSPRASYKGAQLLKDSGWTAKEIADSVLFKGIDAGTRDAILDACPLPKVGA